MGDAITIFLVTWQRRISKWCYIYTRKQGWEWHIGLTKCNIWAIKSSNSKSFANRSNIERIEDDDACKYVLPWNFNMCFHIKNISIIISAVVVLIDLLKYLTLTCLHTPMFLLLQYVMPKHLQNI